jgi:ArsR family transcriptional regulator, lead/cadmium/zinc/bismuth-responsive transcriptional repressor
MDKSQPVDTDRCELLCLDLLRAQVLRNNRLAIEDAGQIADRADALGDPTRIQMAVALRDGGELCVCDLAWIVERSDALVSHHLRRMRLAGVVVSRREKKMVMYQLTGIGLGVLNLLAPEPIAEQVEAR